MEGSIAIDVEGSNESATEDPAAVESEEKELGTSKVSAAQDLRPKKKKRKKHSHEILSRNLFISS